MVAVMRPPITVIASGFCTSAPVPCAMAIGTKPNDGTIAVISTERKRSIAPPSIAASTSIPDRNRAWMLVIITRPLSTETPNSTMNPTAADTEQSCQLRRSANTPAETASGPTAKNASAQQQERREGEEQGST